MKRTIPQLREAIMVSQQWEKVMSGDLGATADAATRFHASHQAPSGLGRSGFNRAQGEG